MPVKFFDVDYIYDPKTPFPHAALKKINLTLKESKITAIVGRTGSGKSTLIQQINALLNPSEGYVDINGFINHAKKKKRSKNLTSLRRSVGMVFQFPEYQLFEDTVEKDVAFGPRNFGASKEEALKMAHEALKKVGLDESFYKRSPFQLSGGERRKVAIAGVLATSPTILVVDEPTSGLDPMAARETMELFLKFHAENTAIFLVTHDMDLVLRYADEAIVLHDGEVVFQGVPRELFSRPLEEYSLERPQVFVLASELEKRGYQLKNAPFETIEDLAKGIAEEYKKRHG